MLRPELVTLFCRQQVSNCIPFAEPPCCSDRLFSIRRPFASFVASSYDSRAFSVRIARPLRSCLRSAPRAKARRTGTLPERTARFALCFAVLEPWCPSLRSPTHSARVLVGLAQAASRPPRARAYLFAFLSLCWFCSCAHAQDAKESKDLTAESVDDETESDETYIKILNGAPLVFVVCLRFLCYFTLLGVRFPCALSDGASSRWLSFAACCLQLRCCS